jgi:hypothetical protein
VRNSFFENSNGVGIVLMDGEQATLSGNSIEGTDGPAIIASCMKGLSILNNYFEDNNRKEVYLQPRPYSLEPWPRVRGASNVTVEADIVLNGAYPPNGDPLRNFAKICASTGVTISGNTFAPVQPNASGVLLVAAAGVSITQNTLLGATAVRPGSRMAVAATGNDATHWLTRDVTLSGNVGWNYDRGPVRVLDADSSSSDHRMAFQTFSAPDALEQRLNFAEDCCQWAPIQGAVLPSITASEMSDGWQVQRWRVPAGHSSAATQALNISLATTPSLSRQHAYFAVKALYLNNSRPLVLLIDPGDGQWKRSVNPSGQSSPLVQKRWEVLSFEVMLHARGVARFGFELSSGADILVMASHRRTWQSRPTAEQGRGSAVVVAAVGADWNQVLKSDDAGATAVQLQPRFVDKQSVTAVEHDTRRPWVNITSMSAKRFPIEGGGPVLVVCTDVPLLAPVGGLQATVQEVSTSLRYPSRNSSFLLSPLLGRPSLSKDCVEINMGETVVAGPGALTLSVTNGAVSSPAEVEYFESVSVAFDRRPYITETTAQLLLETDASILGQLDAVELHLPSRSRPLSWRSGADLLPSAQQQLLPFDLTELPGTVNQDCRVVITLIDGRNLTKWRRLMRALPLATGSTVQAVQVDHTTRGLLVDGRPYTSIGFYYNQEADATVQRPVAGFPNLTEYITHFQARQGISQGQFYQISVLPHPEILKILDQLAAVGFKVLFNPGHVGLELCNGTDVPGAPCFDSQQALASIKSNVSLVMNHPALLGYCELVLCPLCDI